MLVRHTNRYLYTSYYTFKDVMLTIINENEDEIQFNKTILIKWIAFLRLLLLLFEEEEEHEDEDNTCKSFVFLFFEINQ